MKILDKLGLKKKKDEDEEEKEKKPSKIITLFKAMNKPLGGAGGFMDMTPKRTPRERQLGIPEYVLPKERMKNFIPPHKDVPKYKKTITDWRPKPGVKNKKGDTW